MIRGLSALGLAVALGSGAAWGADKPFDPSRDPGKDLAAAEAEAVSGHKNILMDVGGNWCGWCLVLDGTLARDAALHRELEDGFVVLHVNYSRENENAAFLRGYPRAHGFPAWYVLSPEGAVLKAEDTAELESDHKLNSGYNTAALAAFLKKYAPAR